MEKIFYRLSIKNNDINTKDEKIKNNDFIKIQTFTEFNSDELHDYDVWEIESENRLPKYMLCVPIVGIVLSDGLMHDIISGEVITANLSDNNIKDLSYISARKIVGEELCKVYALYEKLSKNDKTAYRANMSFIKNNTMQKYLDSKEPFGLGQIIFRKLINK